MQLHLTQVINEVPLVRKMMNLSRLTITLVIWMRYFHIHGNLGTLGFADKASGMLV